MSFIFAAFSTISSLLMITNGEVGHVGDRALVAYTVTIGAAPEWQIDVKIEFEQAPETIGMSAWSSYVFEQGWGVAARNVRAIDDHGPRILDSTEDGRWRTGVQNERMVVEYTLDFSEVFEAHNDLPKTTAPWTDGQSLAVPGFCVFIHGDDQGEFEVEFQIEDGMRADCGWPRDGQFAFHGNSLQQLLRNTIVIGHHDAVVVERGGFQITAVPLGRHRAAAHELTPILESHAMRFHSLFDYPESHRYLMVIIDDAWETGESYTDTFAMSEAMPLSSVNRVAWGKTVAHELFHFWNGSRMRAEDWATSQWFSEGTTDYLASRAMVSAGFMSPEQFLDEMQKHIGFYELFKQGIVYEKISIVEAGRHKTTHNAAVYDGGWLVAFCFDTIIREHSKGAESLETLIRSLWDAHSVVAEDASPYNNEDVVRVGAALGGTEIREFFDLYVAGVERIPLEAMLARAGLQVVLDAQLAWVSPISNPTPLALKIRQAVLGE